MMLILGSAITIAARHIYETYFVSQIPKNIGDWQIEKINDKHIIASIKSNEKVLYLREGQVIRDGGRLDVKELFPAELKIICKNDYTTIEINIKNGVSMTSDEGAFLAPIWYKFDKFGIINRNDRKNDHWNLAKDKFWYDAPWLLVDMSENQHENLYFWFLEDEWAPTTGFKLAHSRKIMKIISNSCGWN